MSGALFNLAAMTVASTGTGTITLGSAATINGVTFLSFAAAGVPDGASVYYSINDPSGASEVGLGTYTSSGTTLTRGAVTSTNSNNAINMGAGSIVRITPPTSQFREILTASRTYYVRTDGSNSNTGLANTAGGAFLTIQKAVDTVAGLDVGSQTVTIQVADGTYTTAVLLKNVVGFGAAGSLVIQGNNGTPANVVISTTSADAFTADGLNVVWDIKDLKIQTTTTGGGIVCKNGATVRYGNLNFGAIGGSSSGQIECYLGGKVTQLSNYTISGAAPYHWKIYDGGEVLGLPSSTITVSGTPAFGSFFILCGTLGLFDGFGITFSGSATGTRYSVYGNAAVFTASGGANYFPGNVAGSTASGGQYL